MKKNILVISILLSICAFNTQAKDVFIQTRDSLIKVVGKITELEEGQAVKAKIFYEKLPYYDDMGIATSKEGSGTYEMYMILGSKYMVEIKSQGFETMKKEIVVSNQGNQQMTLDFVLELDFANKKITIENLNFASSRSVISTSSYPGLDEFANWLIARPSAIVQLDGHTDFQGNAEANFQLSRDRVEAVKDYLVDKGIKKNRIWTKAFGGTQPLTKERTAEGRAQNRRVEVQILHQ